MNLIEYFDQHRGIGVLSTADTSGMVNSALYARPHFRDEQTLAFIMTDRHTHANLQTNPQASYLFVEEGGGYRGCRLHLMMISQESDPEAIAALKRRPLPTPCMPEGATRFLVWFRVDRVRPLLGEQYEDAEEPAKSV